MNLSWIKKVYLYLVSLISLVILVIASIMLINLVLKTWVFPKADDDYYYYPAIAECGTSVGNLDVMPECSNDQVAKDKEHQRELDRRAAQKQRDAAQALAMIIVASPVFYYHWKLARKEA